MEKIHKIFIPSLCEEIELNEIDTSWVDSIEKDHNLFNYRIESFVIEKMIRDKELSLENLTQEALKRKGYDFNNKLELFDFIKNYCSVEEHIDYPNEKIYCVKGLPFLKTITPELDMKFDYKENCMSVSAELFTYKFL